MLFQGLVSLVRVSDRGAEVLGVSGCRGVGVPSSQLRKRALSVPIAHIRSSHEVESLGLMYAFVLQALVGCYLFLQPLVRCRCPIADSDHTDVGTLADLLLSVNELNV